MDTLNNSGSRSKSSQPIEHTPYLLQIGEEGGVENTVRFDRGLKNGVYFYRGILTNKSIADWFDLSYRDINLLIL